MKIYYWKWSENNSIKDYIQRLCERQMEEDILKGEDKVDLEEQCDDIWISEHETILKELKEHRECGIYI